MKIRIKSGDCPSYLTRGKVYDVIEFNEDTIEHAIINDNNWHTWICIHYDEIHLNGGTWSNGRHSRGSGFAKDCEKYNAAAKLGYFVIKGTTDQVRSGQLLQDIKEMIQGI